MITSNVIHRVFRIRQGGREATSFTLDVDGRQYIVTARHAVETLQDSGVIDIFAHGVWNSSPVRLVGHAPGERDISVLAVDHQLTPARLTMEPTSKGVIYGQDVFFLGFPYGLLGKFLLTEHGPPLPLVKKAAVSLFQSDEVFLLDGHNNPGFSGGPVVFTTPPASVSTRSSPSSPGTNLSIRASLPAGNRSLQVLGSPWSSRTTPALSSLGRSTSPFNWLEAIPSEYLAQLPNPGLEPAARRGVRAAAQGDRWAGRLLEASH